MSSVELKRLNKFISESGFCSRREADALIEQGKVTINGEVPELGTKVAPSDVVAVDGKVIAASAQDKSDRVYIIYHKPIGVTCTTERDVKGNIVDAIGHSQRIFPIGRLDKPSEGLILLTSDGDIVNKILRAENAHDKEYLVTVDKPVSPRFAQRMEKGVPILGTMTKPCQVTITGRQSFRIVLTQGLNRQIRRMCEFLGYEVESLKRIRVMHFNLKGLKPGEWRELSPAEMDTLNQAVADSRKTSEKAEFIENVQSNLRTGKHSNQSSEADSHVERKPKGDYVFKGEGRSGHKFDQAPRHKDKPKPSHQHSDAGEAASDNPWGQSTHSEGSNSDSSRGDGSRGEGSRGGYSRADTLPRGNTRHQQKDGQRENSSRQTRSSENRSYRGTENRTDSRSDSRTDRRNDKWTDKKRNSPHSEFRQGGSRQDDSRHKPRGEENTKAGGNNRWGNSENKRVEKDSKGRQDRHHRSDNNRNDQRKDKRFEKPFEKHSDGQRTPYKKRDHQEDSFQRNRRDDSGKPSQKRDNSGDWSSYNDERPRNKPKLTRYTPEKRADEKKESKSPSRLSLKKPSK